MVLIKTSLLAVVKVSAQIHVCPVNETVGSLNKGVFERRTSIGSEAFSLLVFLNASKLVLRSVLTLSKSELPKNVGRTIAQERKGSLLVEVRRFKTP